MNVVRFPVRRAVIILMLLAAGCLSACTANTSSTDEHGLLPHLTVDMRLPAELSPGAAGQFEIDVRLKGMPVEAAHVVFEFWPEDHPEQLIAITGVSGGNGLYTVEHLLNSEGVYVVRSRVASGLLEVMPAKRIAIGEAAVLRLAELEKQASGEADSGGGHH